MTRATFVAAASAMALFALDLAACSRSTPSVTDVSWNLARQADGKGYRLTGAAKLAGGPDGWYPGDLTLIDDEGCKVETYVGDPRSGAEKSRSTTQTYDQTISFSHPVARAIFSIRYNESEGLDHPESFVDKPMFEQSRIVDASLHPPATPDSRCKFRKGTVEADAHEKAAAQGPYANMSRQRFVATAINSAGFLCARITDLYPNSAGEIIAHCVKYRSGRGRATYRIDADGGTVEEGS